MKKLAVCAIIFNPKNLHEIVLVSRKDNHCDLGLPGGKVDEGETPEEALVREVLEETGIKIKVKTKAYEDVDDNGYHTITYFCHPIGGLIDINTSEAGLVKVGSIQEIVGEKCSFKEYNQRLINSFKTVEQDEL